MKIMINEKELEANICVMSEEPLKYGIGIKITEPVWKLLKEEKKLKVDGKECYITDEVDIGDRTWFIFAFKNTKLAKKHLK